MEAMHNEDKSKATGGGVGVALLAVFECVDIEVGEEDSSALVPLGADDDVPGPPEPLAVVEDDTERLTGTEADRDEGRTEGFNFTFKVYPISRQGKTKSGSIELRRGISPCSILVTVFPLEVEECWGGASEPCRRIGLGLAVD